MNRSPELLICVEHVDGGGVICRAPVCSIHSPCAPETNVVESYCQNKGTPKGQATRGQLCGRARLSHSFFNFVVVAMRLCLSSIRKHTRGRQRSFGALFLSGSEAFTRNLVESQLWQAN